MFLGCGVHTVWVRGEGVSEGHVERILEEGVLQLAQLKEEGGTELDSA